MQNFKKRNGISLIEVVLTMAILVIVLQVVYSVFFTGQSSFAVSTNKGFAQQGVRLGHSILNDELRLATSFISQDEYNDLVTNTKFFGLLLDGDELVKNSYIYNIDDNNYDINEELRIPVVWSNILINNATIGELNILIHQTESSMNRQSEYSLDYEISLINADLLKSDLEWDVTGGDVIYYTVGNDSSIGSIKLAESSSTPIDDDGSGTGTDDLALSVSSVYSKPNSSYDQIFESSGVFQLDKNKPYRVVFSIGAVTENTTRTFTINNGGTIIDTGDLNANTYTYENSKANTGGYTLTLYVKDIDTNGQIIKQGQVSVSIHGN